MAFAILIDTLVLPEPVGPRITIVGVFKGMLSRNAPSLPSWETELPGSEKQASLLFSRSVARSLRGSVAPYLPRRQICSSKASTLNTTNPKKLRQISQLDLLFLIAKTDGDNTFFGVFGADN